MFNQTTEFASRITAVVAAIVLSVTCLTVAVSPAHAAPVAPAATAR